MHRGATGVIITLMGLVKIEGKVRARDLKIAGEDYGDYIKVVIDVETGEVVIGGEWHADAERLLVEKGSKQINIYGGGVNIRTKQIETVALINIRPVHGNNSMEILDKEIRERFIKILKNKFQL